jgi:hypothetical protein
MTGEKKIEPVIIFKRANLFWIYMHILCVDIFLNLRINFETITCWGSAQITKILLPTQPQIVQDLSSSNAVTINEDSRRPNARITPLHMRWWWSRCSRPQCCEDLNVTIPVRKHRCNDLVSHVQHLVVLVHIRWTMTPSETRIQPRLWK